MEASVHDRVKPRGLSWPRDDRDSPGPLAGLPVSGGGTVAPADLTVTARQSRTQTDTWDWTGEYGLPGSPLSRVSLFIFVFRQAMYRLQKSLHSSLTFSSSRRWMRKTWIAFTI